MRPWRSETTYSPRRAIFEHYSLGRLKRPYCGQNMLWSSKLYGEEHKRPSERPPTTRRSYGA